MVKCDFWANTKILVKNRNVWSKIENLTIAVTYKMPLDKRHEKKCIILFKCIIAAAPSSTVSKGRLEK